MALRFIVEAFKGIRGKFSEPSGSADTHNWKQEIENLQKSNIVHNKLPLFFRHVFLGPQCLRQQSGKPNEESGIWQPADPTNFVNTFKDEVEGTKNGVSFCMDQEQLDLLKRNHGIDLRNAVSSQCNAVFRPSQERSE